MKKLCITKKKSCTRACIYFVCKREKSCQGGIHLLSTLCVLEYVFYARAVHVTQHKRLAFLYFVSLFAFNEKVWSALNWKHHTSKWLSTRCKLTERALCCWRNLTLIFSYYVLFIYFSIVSLDIQLIPSTRTIFNLQFFIRLLQKHLQNSFTY